MLENKRLEGIDFRIDLRAWFYVPVDYHFNTIRKVLMLLLNE